MFLKKVLGVLLFVHLLIFNLSIVNWKLISLVVALSSLIPLITGVIKFNKIHNKYKSFIYLIALYALTEIVGQILIFINQAVLHTLMMNVFVFLDFFFLYTIIVHWIRRKPKVYDYAIVILLAFIWIYDNLILNKITVTNSIFRIIYSIVICAISISLMNKQIMNLNRQFFRDPLFIIGLSSLIFYTYKAIYESIYLINVNNNHTLIISFGILIIINFLNYLLLTIAILCMEKRNKIFSTY